MSVYNVGDEVVVASATKPMYWASSSTVESVEDGDVRLVGHDWVFDADTGVQTSELSGNLAWRYIMPAGTQKAEDALMMGTYYQETWGDRYGDMP